MEELKAALGKIKTHLDPSNYASIKKLISFMLDFQNNEKNSKFREERIKLASQNISVTTTDAVIEFINRMILAWVDMALQTLPSHPAKDIFLTGRQSIPEGTKITVTSHLLDLMASVLDAMETSQSFMVNQGLMLLQPDDAVDFNSPIPIYGNSIVILDIERLRAEMYKNVTPDRQLIHYQQIKSAFDRLYLLMVQACNRMTIYKSSDIKIITPFVKELYDMLEETPRVGVVLSTKIFPLPAWEATDFSMKMLQLHPFTHIGIIGSSLAVKLFPICVNFKTFEIDPYGMKDQLTNTGWVEKIQ